MTLVAKILIFVILAQCLLIANTVRAKRKLMVSRNSTRTRISLAPINTSLANTPLERHRRDASWLFEYFQFKRQQTEAIIELKIWEYEMLWKVKIFIKKCIVKLLAKIFGIAGYHFLDSEVEYLEHYEWHYDRHPEPVVTEPPPTPYVQQAPPPPTPNYAHPAGPPPNNMYGKAPPPINYESAYGQTTKSPVDYGSTTEEYPYYENQFNAHANQRQVSRLAAILQAIRGGTWSASNAQPAPAVSTTVPSVETVIDNNVTLTDQEAHELALDSFADEPSDDEEPDGKGDVQSTGREAEPLGWTLAFFQLIDVHVNWIMDVAWALMKIPFALVWELVMYNLYLFSDTFFKLVGYNAPQCRMKLVCLIATQISDYLPAILKKFVESHLGLVLTIGAMNSEYFDSVFTGYMQFNCSNYYADPSC